MPPKRSKKGIDVSSEVLNFQYERPKVHEYNNLSSSRRYSSQSIRHVSPLQQMQANFKFILNPLTSPLETSLYNPDDLLPWEHVECVIADIRNEDSLKCPICIGCSRIPKISKCGHIFCYTCILRHLEYNISLGKSSHKCPMCSHLISSVDELKSVKFVTKMPLPHENDSIEFQLLKLSEGSVSPKCITPLSHDFYNSNSNSNSNSNESNKVFLNNNANYLSVSEVIPMDSTSDAIYSRISVFSVDGMDEFHQIEMDELIAFREECLLVSEFDTSYNIAINDSKPVEQVQNTSTENEVNNQTSESGSPAVNVWEKNTLFKSASKVDKSAKSTYQRSFVSMDLIDVTTNADVEYLPFIAMAMKLLEQKIGQYLVKLNALHPIVLAKLKLKKIKLTSAPGVLVSTTEANGAVDPLIGDNTENRMISTAVSTDSVGNIPTRDVYMYQSANGDLLFVHPLCLKTLFKQHEYTSRSPSSKLKSTEATVKYENLPTNIIGKVVEIEQIRVTSNARQRIPFLRHIPENCYVSLVEIDMRHSLGNTSSFVQSLSAATEVDRLDVNDDIAIESGLVSTEVLKLFETEYGKRAQRRKELKLKLLKEKKIDDILRKDEDKQRATRVENALIQERQRQLQMHELLSGPSITTTAPSICNDFTDDNESIHFQFDFEEELQNMMILDLNNETRQPSTSNVTELEATANTSVLSFAKIAQLGGNFPSLSESTAKTKSSSVGVKKSPWGVAVAKQQSSVNGSDLDSSSVKNNRSSNNQLSTILKTVTGQETTVYASKTKAKSGLSTSSTSSVTMSESAGVWGRANAVHATSNVKPSKKGVSILSNASSRSYK